jgi:hypothetical protein
LTQYSGLTPGDLDRQSSPHYLTTVKHAYVKLRALVERGVRFVGHGLRADFQMLNIIVPPEQVCDTVDLFHLPNQRKLSLRFLARHLLRANIQEVRPIHIHLHTFSPISFLPSFSLRLGVDLQPLRFQTRCAGCWCGVVAYVCLCLCAALVLLPRRSIRTIRSRMPAPLFNYICSTSNCNGRAHCDNACMRSTNKDIAQDSRSNARRREACMQADAVSPPQLAGLVRF